MSSKFGQIRPLVSMATDRVVMAKTVSPLSAVFHPILFILADNRTLSRYFGNGAFFLNLGKFLAVWE